MLSIYLSQALNSEVIEIKGDKERTRDFIHVDDVVSAIEMSIDNPSSFKNEIFNLCTGTETSAESLIDKISIAMDKKLTIKQIDGYVGDQYHSSGYNDKLRRTGWAPSKTVDDGIREFLDFVEATK